MAFSDPNSVEGESTCVTHPVYGAMGSVYVFRLVLLDSLDDFVLVPEFLFVLFCCTNSSGM